MGEVTLFIPASERLNRLTSKWLPKEVCEKAYIISTINVQSLGKTWPKNIKTT